MSRQPLRTLAVVIAGVAVSVLVLHGQISEALVVRGDDLAYRGDGLRARVMFHRALWFDRSNANALDRLAFSALITHDSPTMNDAAAACTAFLKTRGTSLDILNDRALLLLALRRYRGAEADYQTLAVMRPNAQALTFAGLAARHLGDGPTARREFRAALTLDPSYRPAAAALAKARRIP